MRMRNVQLVTAFAALGAGLASAAERGRLLRLADGVGRDAIAAAFIMEDNGPSGEALPARDFVGSVADGAQQLGLLTALDEDVRVWVEVVAAAGVASRYPLAAALYDVQAVARQDGGHELAGLSAALLIDTGGENGAVERRIRHLLHLYTNSEQTSVTVRQRGGRGLFRLRDRRLPDWAGIEWGAVEKRYGVAIGPDGLAATVERLEQRGSSLAGDGWFQRATTRIAGPDTFLAVYVNFDALRRKVDGDLWRKVMRVSDALEWDGIQRAVARFRWAGRALEIVVLAERDGRDEMVRVAGPNVLAGNLGVLVPETASAYAAIAVQPGAAVHRFSRAYLAARSPEAQQSIRQFWNGLQTRAEVAFQRDMLDQLGGVVVIHDYPKHALRLPLAWTIVLPVTGDSDVVRRSLDRLFGYLSREVLGPGLVQLRRDNDGLWSMFFGLSGPALLVTERHVVISFSPAAVRQNVSAMGAAVP